jgi:outer membrane protein OmpA-like peptidoglycan-associated protein
VLVAAGSASSRWIAEARARSRGIAGVARYDDSALTDADASRFEALRRRIEGRVLLFPRGSSELPSAEIAKLKATASDLGEAARIAAALGRTLQVEVIGRGDSVGSEEANLVLSRRRAERVAETLRPAGRDGLTLAVVGVGSAKPLKPEVTENDRDWNRSVSFRLVAGPPDRAGSPSP